MSRPSRSDGAAGPARPRSAAQRFNLFAAVTRRWPRALNAYPPFVGAGIRITRVTGDWRYIRVEMRLRRWNRNLVNTHFGGSLFAMTDPFFMLMLARNLGPDYVVWDRSSTIHFRRPGRDTVTAEFRLTPEQITTIRAAADRDGRTNQTFTATVHDASGETVADVEKILYVRAPTANRLDAPADPTATIRPSKRP